MKYLKLIEIQPGGWILLSLLCFFLDLEMFLIVLCCIVIHESGHLMLLELFGIRVRRITLDFTGFTIHFHSSCLFGIRECITAAAGPVFGLSAAVLFSLLGNMVQNEHLLMLAGGNAVLSAFNLLPCRPLDGWRILQAIFPGAAEVISFCTAFLVLAVGVFLMYAGYGTTLALMGILLIMQKPLCKKAYSFAY